MKRNVLSRLMAVLLSLGAALAFCSAGAQNTDLLDRMCAGLAKSCVEMECSWSAHLSGVATAGTGELKMQGDMWTLVGNGVEMWCDGKSVWVIDPSLKEVVIEPLEDDAQVRYLTNPALIFVRLQDMFTVSVFHPTEDGKAVFYGLKPNEDSDIDYLNVELLSADALIRRGSIAMKSGDIINIEVSSMKLTPEVSAEAFSPQYVFDSSWIVTDLR